MLMPKYSRRTSKYIHTHKRIYIQYKELPDCQGTSTNRITYKYANSHL